MAPITLTPVALTPLPSLPPRASLNIHGQVEARLRDESDKSDTLARQHARLLTELESLEGRNAQIQAALDEKTEAYTKLLMQYESTIFELDFLRAQEQGLGSEAGSWVDEPDATDFAVASNAEIADALCEMLEHACEVLAVEVESGAAMAPFLDVASAFRDSAVQATTLMETVLDTPVPEGDVSNDSEDSEHLDNLAQAADDILQVCCVERWGGVVFQLYHFLFT